MAEKFDYNKVQSTIEDLEVLFDTFADKLRIANDAVTEYVNNGPTIYGDYGKALLNLWDENSSTFGDFKANFDDWVKMVTIVGINNQNFEANITKATSQMSREEFTKSNYGKFISNSNYASKVTDSNYRKVMGFDKEEEEKTPDTTPDTTPVTTPSTPDTTEADNTPKSREEALTMLADDQLYYDPNVSKTISRRTFYRNGTSTTLTYLGTTKDGVDLYYKEGSNDLYYDNPGSIVAGKYSGSKKNFEVYDDTNISNAQSDNAEYVASMTFTKDPDGSSRTDRSFNRGGHTFQYFGTGPDGTIYYKYQSNSDTLYVFNDEGRAKKVSDFDADDVYWG